MVKVRTCDYDADVLSQVMYNMMNQLGHEATLDTLVDMESGCEKYASKNHMREIVHII